MLPRERRLTKNREFQAVFSKGKAYAHRLVILKIRPGESGQPGRWGFSTSVKLGSSVVRNRAKRRLRESVRLLGDSIRSNGYDAVIVARPPIRTATFAEISQAVQELIKKAGVCSISVPAIDGQSDLCEKHSFSS